MRIVLVGLFLLVSCGQDVKHTGGIPTGLEKSEEDQTDDSGTAQPSVAEDDSAMMIQDGAEIPPCDKDNKLIYVKAESTFKVCVAGVWENIDLKGAAGTNGTNGIDNRVARSIHCSGPMEDIDWHFYYNASEMTSGDVFVSASVTDASIEISNSRFFSSKQNGAATASVILAFDGLGALNAGWWKLDLDRTNLIVSIQYSDADAPGGKMNWTMPASKCIVNDYTVP